MDVNMTTCWDQRIHWLFPNPPWIWGGLHFLEELSVWFVSARNDVIPYLKNKWGTKRCPESPKSTRQRFSTKTWPFKKLKIGGFQAKKTSKCCNQQTWWFHRLPRILLWAFCRTPFRKVTVFCEHDGLESEIGSTRSCKNWCEHVTTKMQAQRKDVLSIYLYHFDIWVDLLHPVVLSRTGISSQSISPLWRQEFTLSYRDDSFIVFVQRHRYPICFANHKCQSNV